MSYTQEFISQITTTPEFRNVELYTDILPAAVLGASGVYGLWRFATDHLRSPRTDSGEFALDPIAAEQTLQETRPRKLSHMRKISAVGATSFALMAMGGEALEPTIQVETVDPNATTAVVIDGSYSMRYPADMNNNETRLGASLDGIIDSLDSTPDDANPAVIITTNQSRLIAPAGVSDNELISRLSIENISSSDKANLASAIEIAAGLQNSGPNSDFSQVIITDGTISDLPRTLEVLSAQEDGNTTVILTGTPEGSYNLSGVDGAEVSAAVNTSFLSDIEGVEVVPVTSSDEIEELLQDTITTNSIEVEEKRWEGFRYVVSTAIAFAGLKTIFGKNKPLRRGRINRRKKES